MRNDGDCASALVKLFFLIMGVVGLLAHWPMWICIVLLAAGGVWIFVDAGGDIDFW